MLLKNYLWTSGETRTSMLLNSTLDRNSRTPNSTAWHRLENKRVCFVRLFCLEGLQDSCHLRWLSSFTKQASWNDALKEINIHARLLDCLEFYRSFGCALQNMPLLLTENNTQRATQVSLGPICFQLLVYPFYTFLLLLLFPSLLAPFLPPFPLRAEILITLTYEAEEKNQTVLNTGRDAA